MADGAIIGLASAELSNTKARGAIPNTTLTPAATANRLNGTKYCSIGTLYSDDVMVRAADPVVNNAPAAHAALLAATSWTNW